MPILPVKGPFEVYWNPGGGDAEVQLSPFLGRIAFTMSDQISTIEHEFFGDTPVDAVPKGTLTEIGIPLTEPTYFKLATLLPGVEKLAGGKIRFSVRSGACSMYDASKVIEFRPVCDFVEGTDVLKYIHIYHAYPYRDFDLGFDREEQRIFMVKFIVFPSRESATYGKLYDFGQPV